LLLGLCASCGPQPAADAGAGGGEASGGGAAAGGGSATGGGTATGGGGSATGGGSGGGDAGVDAGNACDGTLYCDGWESYPAAGIANAEALGPWKASLAGDGGALWISSTRAKNGAHSLRYSVPAGGPAHGTLNQKKSAGLAPGNVVFGRTWLYYELATDAGLPLGVHSWVFQSNGPGADGGNTSINLGGGGTKLQLNYHFPASATEQSVQGGTVTTDAWHCIQWEYDASGDAGTTNVARVWLDGTQVIEVLTAKGWDMSRPWNNFDFGFNHYQELGNGVDVYLDDFALGANKLECP
jgi:hypothetical protein